MSFVKKILRTKVQLLEKTKQNRLMLLSNCAICDKKKSTFIKNKRIINKFLLTAGKFMPEFHLKQPGFTLSVCEPFTKDRERI